MRLDQWLILISSALSLALLLAACVILLRRWRRLRARSRESWLTDAMVEQIIEVGVLSERQVPEPTLDLEEIAKEEERFWSETWDEPERYWE
jgi:predicted permease